MNRDTSGKGRRPGAVRPKVRPSWRRDETGAVAVITGLCLMLFMMLLALVLDIGHIMAVRSELQNAADASAMAGARQLLQPDPTQAGRRVTAFDGIPSCGAATTAAGTLTNLTDHQNIAIAPADIQLGHWGWPGEAFPLNQFVPLAACSLDVNAIQVTTRKDANLNQPVATWFARVFGIDTVNVTSRPAVAAVGFVNGEGGMFPIALQKQWLDVVLKQPITLGDILFSPDKKDNGGWAGPEGVHPNANDLSKWIENGFPKQITIDNDITLQNGVDASVYGTTEKVLPNNSQNYTIGGNSYNGWLVAVPVVGVTDMEGITKILAFQSMVITNVDKKTKTFTVVFYRSYVLVDGGLPGGSPSSKVLANIPRLVQ